MDTSVFCLNAKRNLEVSNVKASFALTTDGNPPHQILDRIIDENMAFVLEARRQIESLDEAFDQEPDIDVTYHNKSIRTANNGWLPIMPVHP